MTEDAGRPLIVMRTVCPGAKPHRDWTRDVVGLVAPDLALGALAVGGGAGGGLAGAAVVVGGAGTVVETGVVGGAVSLLAGANAGGGEPLAGTLL